MNVLHTSDWHLGRTLYGRKRYDEFEAFLDWLVETMRRTEIDVLLVAGDVFDTGAPSNRAQALYYRFLRRVASSSCRHAVIVAGNHDSPTFLEAPKALLEVLDVHVIGCASEDPEDEVLVLRNEQGAPELIVCAVPYLRDRDVRVAEAGESVADKEQKLVDGIRDHYAVVAALAERRRAELGGDLPIVALGHLFAAGGQTVDGDGVRELYVGSAVRVAAGAFPDGFDYVALGHLHVPQKVNGLKTIRYSGSPLPMGFGEANRRKGVYRVAFHGRKAFVEQIETPVFQGLERLRGDWEAISGRIRELSGARARVWLEVVYDGDEVIGDLRERLEDAVADTPLELLRVRNDRVVALALRQMHAEETLDDLDVNGVFDRCLAVHEVPEGQRAELLRTYRETLSSLDEDDVQAE